MSPADSDDDRHPPDPAGPSDSFEEIVAGWRAEGAVPHWPDERPGGLPVRAGPARPEPAVPESPPSFEQPRDTGDVDDILDPDDHFVPPEPPPMPRVGRTALVGVMLLAVGLLLVIAPEVVGIADGTGLTLGLLTLAGGLGWLVFRSWSSDPPPGDGDGVDDGAVL